MGNVRLARVRIKEIDFFLDVLFKKLNCLDSNRYFTKKKVKEIVTIKQIGYFNKALGTIHDIESKFQAKHKLEVKYYLPQFEFTDDTNTRINLAQFPLRVIRDCLEDIQWRLDSLLYRLSVIDKMLNKPLDEEVIDEMHILRYELNNLSTKLVKVEPELKKYFFKEKPLTVKKEHKPKDPILYTRQELFYEVILISIENYGGAASKSDVLDDVLFAMGFEFNKYDIMYVDDKNSKLRWQHTVEQAKSYLVENGLMKKSKTRGIWEITENGQRYINGENYMI